MQRFVERNLDGSVSPFIAYLSEAGSVSDDELRELEEIVARLNATQGEGTMMLATLLRASIEGAVLVTLAWTGHPRAAACPRRAQATSSGGRPAPSS